MNAQVFEDTVVMPKGLIFDTEVPAGARLTWVQLRAHARDEAIAPVSIEQLADLTKKHPSTLYRHLSALRERGWLEWRPAGQGRLSVSFPGPFDRLRAGSSPKLRFGEGEVQQRRRMQDTENVSQKRDKGSQNREDLP